MRACEQRGAALRLHFGGPRRQTFTLDGAFVETRHAETVIRSGRLIPARDGLFGVTQSWIARNPEPGDQQNKTRAVDNYFRAVDVRLARRDEATRCPCGTTRRATSPTG